MVADEDRVQRLQRVLPAIGRTGGIPVPLASESNDAWRIGDTVLRVCWRGDRSRFDREAAVIGAMPAAIPVPRLLDTGRVDELAWQLTAVVDGVSLGAVWSGLDRQQQRVAITQLGTLLSVLNVHAFPPEVRELLDPPRSVEPPTLDAVPGADLNPLPVQRTRFLLAPASNLPGVESALIDAVAALLDRLEPLDPVGERALAARAGGVLVHGDAHPMNVLWNDGIVALLDLEWARLGSPEMEIEPFLPRGPDPRQVADARRRLGWLAAAHPDAFAGSDLVNRVWLIELAYAVRHLLLSPPEHGHPQEPEHPLQRLRRIVQGPAHLENVLPMTAFG